MIKSITLYKILYVGILSITLLSGIVHHPAYAQSKSNLYVWTFGTREGTIDDFTQQITIEFEEAIIQAGCCSILNRRNYDIVASQRENEKAIMAIEGIAEPGLQELKAREATGVIFGEVYDDIESGQVRIMAIVQAFDGKIVTQDSIKFSRGLKNDATTREKNMQELAQKLCTHISPGLQPFTGSIKFHQGNGALTFYVVVDKGKVVSGYQSFGNGEPFAQIVGGWYDRAHLVTLIQLNDFDITNQWFSQAVHFRKEGNTFVNEEMLWGYKKTSQNSEMSTYSHPIDEINEK